MVLTDEERRERQRISKKKYYERNIQLTKDRAKVYTQSEKGQKYYESEKCKLKKKEYCKTEQGIKKNIKGNWKFRGLNMENFEEIYERYKMAIFCDICECVLEGTGRNKKCMDHCHITGEFRNVVCHYCNLHICK